MDVQAIEGLQKVTDTEGQVVLLQLRCEAFSETICIANDTRDYFFGNPSLQYIGLPFYFKLPEAQQGGSARAQLAVDNVGRGITEEFEKVLPGQIVMAKIMVMQRTDPLVEVYSTFLPINNLSVNETMATADCGIGLLTSQKGVKLRFTPYVSPGLF